MGNIVKLCLTSLMSCHVAWCATVPLRLSDDFASHQNRSGCHGVHTVDVARTVILVGEPLVVRMCISNATSQMLSIPYANDVRYGIDTYFLFGSTNGLDYRGISWGPCAIQTDPCFEQQDLMPGEIFRRNILVSCNFDESGPVKDNIPLAKGTNWIRLVHACGWRSLPLKVSLVESSHSDDISASSIMCRSEVAAFICSDLFSPGKVIASIRGDVETVANGKGRLAPYAALRLATYCFESQQMTDALKWAKMADVDGFVMQDKAVFLQAKSCLKLQDIERGSNFFARIRRDFPYSESACKLRYEEGRLLAEAERAVKEQRKAEGVRNEAARWKDAPAATRKEIEQTVDTLMKKFMTLDERGSSGMMTDNFVMNGHCTKAQLLERFRRELKEAKEKLPIVSTVFEQVVTDGSNVIAQMEFTFRSEGRERKKRDRMTFVQKGNKGVWLLAIWDSTPVDSPEMKKWEEEVVRMTIEGKTNGFPERPRPK